MASLTRWAWVWASSRSWWWTGKPDILLSMGLQRVRHDWVTELKCRSLRLGCLLNSRYHRAWCEWYMGSRISNISGRSHLSFLILQEVCRAPWSFGDLATATRLSGFAGTRESTWAVSPALACHSAALCFSQLYPVNPGDLHEGFQSRMQGFHPDPENMVCTEESSRPGGQWALTRLHCSWGLRILAEKHPEAELRDCNWPCMVCYVSTWEEVVQSSGPQGWSLNQQHLGPCQNANSQALLRPTGSEILSLGPSDLYFSKPWRWFWFTLDRSPSGARILSSANPLPLPAQTD